MQAVAPARQVAKSVKVHIEQSQISANTLRLPTSRHCILVVDYFEALDTCATRIRPSGAWGTH